jgi:hypothetical protein
VSRDRQVVGFDRTIDLSWMDATAGFVADGMSVAAVRRRLFEYLEGIVPGDTPHTQRGKTITVLSRVWSRVTPEGTGMRDDALRLYPELESDGRLAVHWAMVLAAYPFFLDTASTVGRLLRLHEETSLQKITRRLEEGWGARPGIYRSAHRVLQTMELWGVLHTAARAGEYRISPTKNVADPRCGTLLADAMLIGLRGGAITVGDLALHPALFPFSVRFDASDMRKAPRLEVHRVGLDVDQINLRARDTGLSALPHPRRR